MEKLIKDLKNTIEKGEKLLEAIENNNNNPEYKGTGLQIKRRIVAWEKNTKKLPVVFEERNLLSGFWSPEEERYIDIDKEGFNPELFPFKDPKTVYWYFYGPIETRLDDLRGKLELQLDPF